MKTRQIILELDDLDFDCIQEYITDYQVRTRGKDGVILPDGDSNLAGAIMAQCVRDLLEYRALWEERFGPS